MTPIKKETAKKSKVSPTAVGIVAAVFSLLVLSAAGLMWLSTKPSLGLFHKEVVEVATEVPTIEGWTGPVLSNYIGKTYDEVASSFNGKIVVSADGEYSDTVPKGSVISQEPPAGTALTGSDPILYLNISKGPKATKLPGIIGKSYIAAAEELTQLGFVVTQQVEFSDSYAEGKVIRYAGGKNAGDSVESGSEVVIIVSRGPQPAENQ